MALAVTHTAVATLPDEAGKEINKNEWNAAHAVAGLGTGVETALGVNVGSAGAPVVNGGVLGTPSSGTATNLTGTAAGLTAGAVTTNANLTGPVTSVGNATAIANGALSYTKLADGTDGNLITWDASGVAALVATGTATHVLTSNGAGAAPTFQAAVAGAPADGSITLAKLANLAQDQFIGRTTASTGVPETATITAAARLVVAGASNAAMQIALGVREVLAAARTYYVRTGGSDSNTGLVNTDGGAFLTIQKAIDVITANLDLSGKTVTIQVADGTYTTPVLFSAPWTGGGTITLQGNSGTPANVVISTTSNDGVSNTGVLPGILTIKDLKIVVTTSGYGLVNYGSGTIQFTNVDFGACPAWQVAALQGGIIQCTGNYAISGGGGGHVLVATGGVCLIEIVTVTISGTPALSIYARALSLGAFIADGCTFSGSATGQRYNIALNAIVNTAGGGASYFPGDVGGATATGGQYG